MHTDMFSDYRQCLKVFNKIANTFGDESDVHKLPIEEYTVVMVCTVTGVIKEGGFDYLFSTDIFGDDDYSETIECFKRIDCSKAVDVFLRTLKLFPNSIVPVDRQERLDIYYSQPEISRMRLDELFLSVVGDIWSALAAYIRINNLDNK